jgi:hypothetical protein
MMLSQMIEKYRRNLICGRISEARKLEAEITHELKNIEKFEIRDHYEALFTRASI